MPKPETSSSFGRKRGNNNSNDNKFKKKSTSKNKLPPSMIKRGNKREVVFDPEARRAHLRGFSERKRERRAFGLAMQKVKDRKAKIEQRASEKKEGLERLEEAERQKDAVMEEAFRMNKNNSVGNEIDSDEDSDHEKIIESKSDKKNNIDDQDDSGPDGNRKQRATEQKQSSDVINTKVYDDQNTEKHWGGQVTVTTSVIDLGCFNNGDSDNGEDGEDDDIDRSLHRNNKKKAVDKAQKYAGDVQRYMEELKSNMPGKKNRDGSKTKRKGKDGAADMKGVGGSGNLKIASKLLSKSKDRSVNTVNNKKGKRKKR